MSDVEENRDDISDIFKAVRWWEEKRLVYNVITLAGGLLVLFIRSEVPNGLSSLDQYFILLVWLFGANIFYTCSWGAEILLNYYFKTRFWGDRTRIILFLLGCIFSLCWMFILTRKLI